MRNLGMNRLVIGLLLMPLACALVPADAREGSIPPGEVSIGGITVGETSAQVRNRLGKPLRESKDSDYLDLHYDFPSVRVSFSEGVVAGLQARSPAGCTPSRLCLGDSVDRMRSLYGAPVVAERESGRYYEYYGEDLYCWLQITAAAGIVKVLTVQCQP